ncbi:MAG: hypothetical protein ACFCU3_04215 [Verrucomicrobiales bacterium]
MKSYLMLPFLALVQPLIAEVLVPEIDQVFSAKEASGKLGQIVVMEDIIFEIQDLGPEGPLYLNFGNTYPKETITVVILPALRHRFEGFEFKVGKTIRVQGEVVLRDGFPRIILREQDQIISVAE